MKRIIFNAKYLAEPKIYKIEDLREAIIKFLAENGMLYSLATEAVQTHDHNSLKFSLNCANSDYTRVWALLQLLFSDAPKDQYNITMAYFSYRAHGTYLNVSPNGNIGVLIEYLKDNSSITIEN